MRTGISITVSPAGRRLLAVVNDRNAAQKHVWRCRIVVLTAEGVGNERDHAPDGQVEDLRLALAGTLCAGGF